MSDDGWVGQLPDCVGPLPDWALMARRDRPAGDRARLVIEPFCGGVSRASGRLSAGLGSYGYDFRLGGRFRRFRQQDSSGRGLVTDPLAFRDECLEPEELVTDLTGLMEYILPPHSYALAETVEWVEVPEDVVVIVLAKSSYARCGLLCNTTPLEPGWKGRPTLEIGNVTGLPIRLHVGQGFCQALFLASSHYCRVPYGDKPGSRYQHQQGLTVPGV